MALNTRINKKKKFVQDGIFYAELNAFLEKELGDDGYAGVEVRRTPKMTEVIIRATRVRNVLGFKGRRIRELKKIIEARWGFKSEEVDVFADNVLHRGLCAMAQAESLRYRIAKGIAVRRYCFLFG